MLKFCFALFLILLTNFDATALKCWLCVGPGGICKKDGHRRNNPEITFALSGHRQNEDDEVLLDRRISCMHRSIYQIFTNDKCLINTYQCTVPLKGGSYIDRP